MTVREAENMLAGRKRRRETNRSIAINYVERIKILINYVVADDGAHFSLHVIAKDCASSATQQCDAN